jgi:hypothetical protein
MIRPADIREWRTRDVVDTKRRRIGSLEAVYVDTRTDEPSVATVLVGLPTRRRLLFVPLTDAILGPDYVKVGYLKEQVRGAPSIGTDDVLPAEEEKAVFEHYGLPYEPGVHGERRLARP